MSRPSVMILDGESRSALSVVRSLGRLGIPVMVGSDSPLGRSGFSRFAVRRFAYPPLTAGLEGMHEAIIRRVREWRPEVLMPVFDEGWSVIHAYYDDYRRLAKIVPGPGRELTEKLADKGQLAEWAEQFQVPMPKTFRPKSSEEVFDLMDRLPYPVLLKPRRSRSGQGMQRVNDVSELVKTLHRFEEMPLIQERIDGQDLELTLLSLHGKALAGCAYLSLRNAPLPFGAPVACRTIREEGLMERGRGILAKLEYHGVAHLDFRRDRRNGEPKLLDFNPRLAGTNEMSTRSGVDFALMQYQLALEEEIRPCFAYEVGIEFRWLGELRHFAQTPRKLRTLWDLFHWHGVSTELCASDLMPHLALAWDGLCGLARKVGKERIP